MRVPVNTTLDKDLYKTIQIMALQLSDSKKKLCANDLIEEGMRLLIASKDNERVEGIE